MRPYKKPIWVASSFKNVLAIEKKLDITIDIIE
jgi:hypothetical protein